MRAAARGELPPAAPGLALPPAGVFVTLLLDDELRGCIGRLDGDEPLARQVGDTAVAAATSDPRFPRLAAHEAERVAVEVSVLSVLEPARPHQVVPGEHGVLLRARGRQGVFLPKVATDQGWDRERLLAELCRKAELPPAVLAEPDAHLFVFRCQVFTEAPA